MELLNYIHQIPVPVVAILVVILVVSVLYLVYKYAKLKGLEGIRKEVYKLFLKAEHKFIESSQGQQNLKWVVQQARGLLPSWLQIILTEEALMKIIDAWFKGIKDLLDDGKVNGSVSELQEEE